MDHAFGVDCLPERRQKSGAVFFPEGLSGLSQASLHSFGNSSVLPGEGADDGPFIALRNGQKKIDRGTAEVGAVLALLVDSDPAVGDMGEGEVFSLSEPF